MAMEEKSSCDYKKGLWTLEEDGVLMEYVRVHGKGKWNRIPKLTGLKRCGKSCRLRWINYLSPGVKRGDFSDQENDLIIRLHNLLGNRWSLIAGRVPGRTDNQVKNHWNTHLSKKLGIKKGKNKVISASSKISAMELRDNCDINVNSTVVPSYNCEEGGIASQNKVNIISDEGESQSTANIEVEGSNSQISYTSWFFHDELKLHTPTNVMMMDEFLDDESLDFVWHGL